jgi:hypothetical protein
VSNAAVVAVLDANVLYPTTLRDLLMWLAVTGTYDAHWTETIQNEWTRNLLEDQPDLTAQRLERTRRLMHLALPGALVTGYEAHMDSLDLPDTDDRHVLAAAIRCEAQVIVTTNLRDFPSAILEPFAIRALHPDAFALHLTEHDPEGVLRAIAGQRGNFRHPPLTRGEYLERLHRQGLRAFTAWLESRLAE